jgi:hypothetical protein
MAFSASNMVKTKKSQGGEQPQTGLSDNASKDSNDHNPGWLVLDGVEPKGSEYSHTWKKFQDNIEKAIVHDIKHLVQKIIDVERTWIFTINEFLLLEKSSAKINIHFRYS